ncbi:MULTISPECIES: chemotaxis protein CheW [Solibacillus]|uniref:Chemotaxis protein CheW n=1 Tax=Solibacillus merdavium TaxID=2762218 RepID=A0ABR8XN95_9BACL|nr:CheW domain-containing protein [Solibacillus merdavium]MBD8033409.1 chemotaxis protein CheW [Solibacillus merdavium]
MGFEKAVVFLCGTEEYAVPVDQVVSIEKLERVTPIPHLPKYLLGFSRIRGELTPVIDFQSILYNRPTDTKNLKVIVLKTEMINYGLLVVDAKEIIDFEEGVLTQLGLVNYNKTKYFTAVANLENRMISCIDPGILVHSLEGMREIIEYLHKMQEEEQTNV